MVDDLHREKSLAPLPRLSRAAAAIATRVLTGSLLAVTGLIGTSLVCGDALTDARPRPMPLSAISERFVFDFPPPAIESVDLSAARREAAAAMAALFGRADAVRKGDRFNAASGGGAAGAPLAVAACRAGHYVTVGLRTGEATSALVRYQVADVASR
jgi:hypothetical protein